MNQTHPSVELLDYHPPSSNVSEVDSLSDSDWLEIFSGRDSDDNDSVDSHDSDRDERGLTSRSRRSSVSVGSSREGEIEAWEGFVDEAPVETIPLNIHSIQSIPDEMLTEPLDTEASPHTERDIAEDQRVRAALDQSLISTLSSSRSSGHYTAQNSLRDLRLSFPDPLTSSREELNRSYEDVLPPDAPLNETELVAADKEVATLTAPPAAPTNEDPGLNTTPEVPQFEVKSYGHHEQATLEVILYGSTSPIKWSFVLGLFEKIAAASDRSLTFSPQSEDSRTRWLLLERFGDAYTRLVDYIVIHDRTDSTGLLPESNPQSPSDRPSLAIVYLPSALPRPAAHTLYLPVFIPVDSSLAAVRIAHSDWESLSIPSNRILRLRENLDSPIFHGGDIDHLDNIRARRIIEEVNTAYAKKRSSKPISEQLNSSNAVTLFALVSLVMGFAFNIAFRGSTPVPTTTIAMPSTSQIMGAFNAATNDSLCTTESRSQALIPSSLKEFALSVITPSTTSLALTSQAHVATGSISKRPTPQEFQLSTWPERSAASRDVALRPEPVTHLSLTPLQPSTSTITPAANVITPIAETTTALGIRFVDSLSEIVDVKMKAIAEVVHNDLNELVEALDDLNRALQQQTNNVMEQSMATAKNIREQVQYRNDRARDKAKELKAKGAQFMSLAGDTLLGRTDMAKKRLVVYHKL
ncbi:hypothetical protein BD779DRAFT_1466340 [Infundibulicybe gibba]|nr:hypothetical protein BD779DRAFT_1466340 [Infundibulicybe gibba]